MENNKKELSYKQAIDELEKIVKEIEAGDLDLDVLLEKVDKAAILILYCKEKLKSSESSISKMLKKLENEE